MAFFFLHGFVICKDSYCITALVLYLLNGSDDKKLFHEDFCSKLNNAN